MKVILLPYLRQRFMNSNKIHPVREAMKAIKTKEGWKR
jgi:hypothetical protein